MTIHGRESMADCNRKYRIRISLELVIFVSAGQEPCWPVSPARTFRGRFRFRLSLMEMTEASLSDAARSGSRSAKE